MMAPATVAEPPPGVSAKHYEATHWTVAAEAPVGIGYKTPNAKVSEDLDPPDGQTPPLVPFDVWELDATGRPRRRRHTGEGPRLTKVVPTSDGSAAVAAGYGSLRVFDLVTGRQRWQLEGHARPVWDVDVVDEAGVAVSGSEDSSVRVWDLTRGSQIAAFQGESPIHVVRGRVHILRLWDDGGPSLRGTRSWLLPTMSPTIVLLTLCGSGFGSVPDAKSR